MLQSASMIKNIFEKMDYGDVFEGKDLAETWLSENESQLGAFINGRLHPAKDNAECTTTGPPSNATLKLNKQQNYSLALSSATSVSTKWSRLKGHARAKILYNIARQLQKNVTLIAQLESLSTGVLLRDLRENDVPSIIRAFYYYAGWAQLTDSDLGDWKALGVVADISCYSSSLHSIALIVAPALAAGNAVICFPPVANCLSALLLAQIFSSAGLLPGVLNVVPLNSADVAEHPVLMVKEVAKVAAIGSIPEVLSTLKHTSLVPRDYALLLNGCVPMIVLESADLDAAVDCAIDAAWNNQGRDPWALRLVIVQEAVMENLKQKLVRRVQGLKIGGAFDKMADVSSTFRNSTIAKRLEEILRINPCAEVVQPHSFVPGEWVPTVIFSAAPPSPPVLTVVEECPVLHVVGARSLKETVNIANHCGSGTAGSVWTENVAQAWEAASLLRVGTVWINGHGIIDASVPLCGRGFSGKRCFSGKEGLMEYLQPQLWNQDSPAHLETLLAKTSLLPKSSILPTADSAFIDVTYKLFYGGAHKRPDSNSSRTLLDSSGKPFAIIPDTNRKDVRNAVEAAVKAQPGWWQRGAHNRAQILFNLAEKLQARQNHFEKHLNKVYCMENNAHCSQEFDECIYRLFYFAALCDKFVHSQGNSAINNQVVTITREPCGVVAILAKSGSALLDVVTLLGAALAYGNTCIIFPCSDYPTPVLELALLLEAAEVPAGVVNVLCGETDAVIPTICSHMEVDAIWCTGFEHDTVNQMRKEAIKSNMKLVWCQQQVPNPCSPTTREIYERVASYSKAIWVPNISSFGS